MGYSLQEVQHTVTRMRRELIVAGYHTEWVDVVEDVLPSGVDMATSPKKVYFDPRKEPECLEWVVSHEIGHRVADVINPFFHSDVYWHLSGNDKDSWLSRLEANIWYKLTKQEDILHSLSEGAAEFLALDVFPGLVRLTPAARDYIEFERYNRINEPWSFVNRRAEAGYLFFRHATRDVSFYDYLRNFQIKDIPTKDQLFGLLN